tara:strand:- start:84 stop:296 length:213 start_codon:yes stop_codon:yes gene_type:complete
MSKKQKSQDQQAQNVISISRCQAEDCAKKDKKAGFCEEHYVWFKEGLITKKGEKVKDFDKKWQHFMARAS